MSKVHIGLSVVPVDGERKAFRWQEFFRFIIAREANGGLGYQSDVNTFLTARQAAYECKHQRYHNREHQRAQSIRRSEYVGLVFHGYGAVKE